MDDLLEANIVVVGGVAVETCEQQSKDFVRLSDIPM